MGKKGYEFRLVAVLAILWGLIALNRIGITFLFPFILPEFNMSATQAGTLVATLAMCYAVSQVVFGGLSDKVGRKKVLVPAVFFFGVFAAITGMVAKMSQLFACWGATGVAGGPTFPPSAAILAEESDPKRRGLNMGIHQSLYPFIGIGIGAIIITNLGTRFGWRTTMMILGAISIIWALIVMLAVKEPPSTVKMLEDKKAGKVLEAKEKVPISAVFKYRNVVVSILVCMCYMTWVFVFSTFCVMFLTKVRGFEVASAGSILSAWGFGGLIGMIAIPAISDFMGRKLTVIVSSVFAGLLVIAFVASGIGPSGLFALLLVGGIFGWGAYPIFLSLFPSETVPPAIIGAALSLPPSIGDLFGSVIMPVFGGILADTYGLSYAMYLAGIAPLLAAVISFAYIETAPKILAKRGIAGGIPGQS